MAHKISIFRYISVLLLMVVGMTSTRAASQTETAEWYYKRYANTPIEEVYQQGMTHLKKGETDKALACLTVVIGRYHNKMSDKERKTYEYALNNAGAIAMLRYDYSTAFSLFTKALDAAADSVAYRTHNNIAGIYIYYNDYNNARKHLDLAYNIGVRKQDWASVYNTTHNLLDLNWNVDSLQNSMPLIEDFRRLSISPKDNDYQFISSICDGMESLHHRQYAEAITHFGKAIEMAQGLDFQESHEIPNYLYMAKAYMDMGEYDKALENLRICERKSEESHSLDMLITTYHYLDLCYQRLGNINMAHAANYRYMELKDSINSANEYGKIKDMEFLHEANKYEKQLHQLTAEKRVHDIVTWAIGIGLLLTLLFLGITIYQNKKLSESNKDLFKKNVALLKSEEKEERIYQEYTEKLEKLEKSETKLPDQERYKSSSLTDESREILLSRIRHVMHTPAEFCKDDFTIDKLATLVNSNTKYVSQVINETLGKNFNTLLNEQRINEVCKRLVDTANNGNKTNEAIAEEVGFKSRSHFIRTFKKITGLTPSQYQRMAKLEIED